MVRVFWRIGREGVGSFQTCHLDGGGGGGVWAFYKSLLSGEWMRRRKRSFQTCILDGRAGGRLLSGLPGLESRQGRGGEMPNLLSEQGCVGRSWVPGF